MMHMRNMTALVAAVCMTHWGCSRYGPVDSEAAALARMSTLDEPSPSAKRVPDVGTVGRVPLPAAEPGEQNENGARVFTWLSEPTADGERRIVVLGRNLHDVQSLRIGDTHVNLAVSADGHEASGAYPTGAPEDHPILVRTGDVDIELAERFSSLKPDRLPKIHRASFAWATRSVPDPQEDRESTVRAIRFDCSTSPYERRSVGVSAYFGNLAVPHQHIIERDGGLIGYVYHVDSLVEGDAVTVDFGHGLRVLVVRQFKWDLVAGD